MATTVRRDKKKRILRMGESIRADGKYQFKYHINGKPHFVYSWRLEPTDPQPKGKKPCKALREMEKELMLNLGMCVDPSAQNITVTELVEKYLKTRTMVKPYTLQNYNFVRNILKKEPFSQRKIKDVRTSDAKLFLIKLQEEGRRHSTVKTVRGVLRPAFQMAVDDDILIKNPFGFELASVVVNDSVTREAISRDQMRKFLKFCQDYKCYNWHYDAFYILFHTGLRISEYCGLTLSDIDFENSTINIDHQLQRTSKMEYVVMDTKTNAGTRVLPMTDDVADAFRRIIERRDPPEVEKMIDGHVGFLHLDRNGMPEVAMHWQHRFRHAVNRYNSIYKVQLPPITPHVCRHTYCSNMARSGMNPKTLQYLMGHSEIGVTMNTYTHLGLEDAVDELQRLSELDAARREIRGMDGNLEKGTIIKIG